MLRLVPSLLTFPPHFTMINISFWQKTGNWKPETGSQNLQSSGRETIQALSIPNIPDSLSKHAYLEKPLRMSPLNLMAFQILHCVISYVTTPTRCPLKPFQADGSQISPRVTPNIDTSERWRSITLCWLLSSSALPSIQSQ